MTKLVRLAAALFALLLVSPLAARADIAPADQNAIHAVIQAQLDAFKKSDFDGAYADAAPGIKALYPTAQAFGGMVQSRYGQLIGTKSVVFGLLTATPDGPIQHVFITGADGMAYVAIYVLQQQPDQTWLIAGCTVGRDRGSSAI